VFTGFAGQEVLLDGDRIIGVRTGDRGVNRNGEPKETFEPGVEILAKVTILCDGVRGNLTKQVINRFNLERPRHYGSEAVPSSSGQSS
jgi:electron-transferring-flavoprotein dehydrogenase